LGTKSFSWISWGRTFLLEVLFQPLFVVVQGRHIFWAQSSLDFGITLIDGTSTSMGSTTSMLYTEGRRGIAPVEMCTVARYPCEVTISPHASLCTWMLSSGQSSWFLFVALTASDAPVCERPHRECFLQLGYKELKVGREYMVDVFNGFINAWFGLLTSISYDYADIWMIKIFFGFLYYHFSRTSTK